MTAKSDKFTWEEGNIELITDSLSVEPEPEDDTEPEDDEEEEET
jgi:hypothetical protein